MVGSAQTDSALGALGGWCLISETVNTNIGVEECETDLGNSTCTNSTPYSSGRLECTAGQRLDDLRDEPMVPYLVLG